MTLRDRWDNWLNELQERYGQKRIIMLGVLIVVGIASLAIHVLIRQDLGHSALLYLAVPYSVAVLITLLRPYSDQDTWWQGYASHSATALVIFLASSAVLLEGFICILFFMPIYFFGVTLAFLASWIGVIRSNRKSNTFATAIPLLVMFLSLEGTTEITTFDRRSTVTATAETAISREVLLQNIASPAVPGSSDDWMVGIFPMPHTVEFGAFEVGAIHRAHTRYHRWFVTNTHEGILELRVDSIAPERITTSVVSDTTFFSSYIDLLGTDLHLVTDANGVTHISLTINYERRLDPAWYFQPIQQYAMQTMASHLLEEVIIRE